MGFREEYEQIVESLKQAIGAENVVDYKIPRERRIFITVKKEAVVQAVKYLAEEQGFWHCSTITGLEAKDCFEVIYHLARDHAISLALRVRLDKEKPEVPTITDVIPGATLYEREVHDLVGIKFVGHPNLKRLILPDNWPDHIHPLRKEWTIERIREELRKAGVIP